MNQKHVLTLSMESSGVKFFTDALASFIHHHSKSLDFSK